MLITAWVEDLYISNLSLSPNNIFLFVGKSIAYQLAEKGYDLFLVARREDRLQDLKLDIENKIL